MTLSPDVHDCCVPPPIIVNPQGWRLSLQLGLFHQKVGGFYTSGLSILHNFIGANNAKTERSNAEHEAFLLLSLPIFFAFNFPLILSFCRHHPINYNSVDCHPSFKASSSFDYLPFATSIHHSASHVTPSLLCINRPRTSPDLCSYHRFRRRMRVCFASLPIVLFSLIAFLAAPCSADEDLLETFKNIDVFKLRCVFL